MAQDRNDSAQNPRSLARFALIGAGLIALVAVGFAVWKRQMPAKTTIAVSDSPAESVESKIARLESGLKNQPNDANGWQMLGMSFYQSGKYAEAAQAYARATQIDPNISEYWSALGEARVLAGPGDVSAEAKLAFTKAVALDPQDPRARYFLAVAKDFAGDHKGALDGWFALLADTPAGAPWEADVRKVITDVGAKEKIEVAARLAAIRPAPANGGAAVATAGIPGPTPEQLRSGGQLPKGQQDAMIDGMVNGLEAKLKANPGNENGWIMLMRSRIQLGEAGKASEALKGARAAFANDSAAKGRIDAAASALGIPL